MEWTVVVVMTTLAALGISIVKPIISLTQTISRLSVLVSGLQDEISGLTSKNSGAHEKLWSKCSEMDKHIYAHENRLAIIEEKV